MKVKIHITKEVLYMTRFCNYKPIEDKKFFENPHSKRFLDRRIGDTASNCAIAYAIYKIFPYATVGNREINLVRHYLEDNSVISVLLPYKARLFIEEFDSKNPINRLKLKPFSFEIEIPEEYLNLIDISELKKQLSVSETVDLID